jgi:hypothetical protein
MTDTDHTTGDGPAAGNGLSAPAAAVDAAAAITAQVHGALAELDRRMSGVQLPPELAAEHARHRAEMAAAAAQMDAGLARMRAGLATHAAAALPLTESAEGPGRPRQD